jgi:phosphate transport system substrate-binding protein
MSIRAAGLLAVVGLVAACGGERPPAAAAGADSTVATAESGTLTGAGATFPNPIYTKWFDTYAKATGVRVNYQSIGSGGGIRQFTEGTVDFGATDGPMNESQIRQSAGT